MKEADDPLALPLSSFCRTCKKLRKKHSVSLQQPITTSETKSYGELLNDLVKNRAARDNTDSLLPQNICRKCATLLKRIYLFILQAENCYKEYLHKINVKAEDCIPDATISLELTEPRIKTETEVNVNFCPNVMISNSTQLAVKEEPNDPIDSNKIAVTADLCHENEDNDQSNSAASIQGVETTSACVENTAIKKNINPIRVVGEENDSRSECDLSNTEASEKDYFHMPRNSWARRCELCNKVYKNASALYIHKKYTHMPDEQKTLCKLCNYKTSRLSNLKAHLKAVHGQESMNNFIKSIPNRENKRTFSCSVCTQKYTRKYDLQRHFKRKHTNAQRLVNNHKAKPPPKPSDCFLCTFCGQAYKTKSGLCMHIRRHTGEKPYKCELCEKRFARREELRLHRVIHYDDKPYNCNVCNKSFKRTDKLKIHMRVHSELRPYKCTECDKSFKYANVLRTHMHIHTGEKPFACNTCGENFSLRSSLKMHCIKHNHEK